MMRSTNGTPAFLAPETLTGDYFDGKGADIWAVGVTMYFMVFGRVPFSSNTTPGMFEKIRANQPDYNFVESERPFEGGVDTRSDEVRAEDNTLRELAIDLMRGMLTSDPNNRPDVRACRRHPFLSKKQRAVMEAAANQQQLVADQQQQMQHLQQHVPVIAAGPASPPPPPVSTFPAALGSLNVAAAGGDSDRAVSPTTSLVGFGGGGSGGSPSLAVQQQLQGQQSSGESYAATTTGAVVDVPPTHHNAVVASDHHPISVSVGQQRSESPSLHSLHGASATNSGAVPLLGFMRNYNHSNHNNSSHSGHIESHSQASATASHNNDNPTSSNPISGGLPFAGRQQRDASIVNAAYQQFGSVPPPPPTAAAAAEGGLQSIGGGGGGGSVAFSGPMSSLSALSPQALGQLSGNTLAILGVNSATANGSASGFNADAILALSTNANHHIHNNNNAHINAFSLVVDNIAPLVDVAAMGCNDSVCDTTSPVPITGNPSSVVGAADRSAAAALSGYAHPNMNGGGVYRAHPQGQLRSGSGLLMAGAGMSLAGGGNSEHLGLHMSNALRSTVNPSYLAAAGGHVIAPPTINGVPIAGAGNASIVGGSAVVGAPSVSITGLSVNGGALSATSTSPAQSHTTSNSSHPNNGTFGGHQSHHQHGAYNNHLSSSATPSQQQPSVSAGTLTPSQRNGMQLSVTGGTSQGNRSTSNYGGADSTVSGGSSIPYHQYVPPTTASASAAVSSHPSSSVVPTHQTLPVLHQFAGLNSPSFQSPTHSMGYEGTPHIGTASADGGHASSIVGHGHGSAAVPVSYLAGTMVCPPTNISSTGAPSAGSAQQFFLTPGPIAGADRSLHSMGNSSVYHSAGVGGVGNGGFGYNSMAGAAEANAAVSPNDAAAAAGVFPTITGVASQQHQQIGGHLAAESGNASPFPDSQTAGLGVGMALVAGGEKGVSSSSGSSGATGASYSQQPQQGGGVGIGGSSVYPATSTSDTPPMAAMLQAPFHQQPRGSAFPAAADGSSPISPSPQHNYQQQHPQHISIAGPSHVQAAGGGNEFVLLGAAGVSGSASLIACPHCGDIFSTRVALNLHRARCASNNATNTQLPPSSSSLQGIGGSVVSSPVTNGSPLFTVPPSATSNGGVDGYAVTLGEGGLSPPQHQSSSLGTATSLGGAAAAEGDSLSARPPSSSYSQGGGGGGGPAGGGREGAVGAVGFGSSNSLESHGLNAALLSVGGAAAGHGAPAPSGGNSAASGASLEPTSHQRGESDNSNPLSLPHHQLMPSLLMMTTTTTSSQGTAGAGSFNSSPIPIAGGQQHGIGGTSNASMNGHLLVLPQGNSASARSGGAAHGLSPVGSHLPQFANHSPLMARSTVSKMNSVNPMQMAGNSGGTLMATSSAAYHHAPALNVNPSAYLQPQPSETDGSSMGGSSHTGQWRSGRGDLQGGSETDTSDDDDGGSSNSSSSSSSSDRKKVRDTERGAHGGGRRRTSDARGFKITNQELRSSIVTAGSTTGKRAIGGGGGSTTGVNAVGSNATSPTGGGGGNGIGGTSLVARASITRGMMRSRGGGGIVGPSLSSGVIGGGARKMIAKPANGRSPSSSSPTGASPTGGPTFPHQRIVRGRGGRIHAVGGTRLEANSLFGPQPGVEYASDDDNHNTNNMNTAESPSQLPSFASPNRPNASTAMTAAGSTPSGSGVSAIRNLATEHHQNQQSPSGIPPPPTAAAAAPVMDGSAAVSPTALRQIPTRSPNHRHYQEQYRENLPNYQFPRNSVASAVGGGAGGGGVASPTAGNSRAASTAGMPPPPFEGGGSGNSAHRNSSHPSSGVGEDDIYAMHGL